MPNILFHHIRPFFRNTRDEYEERFRASELYAKIQDFLRQKGDIAFSELSYKISSLVKTEGMVPILLVAEKALARAVEDWNSNVQHQGYPTFGKSPAEIVSQYVYMHQDRPGTEHVKYDRVEKILR